MAITYRAQFIDAGNNLIGNELSVLGVLNDGTTETLTITGDPGLTVLQLSTAKLGYLVTDGSGGFVITTIEVGVPTFTGTRRALTRSRGAMRGTSSSGKRSWGVR